MIQGITKRERAVTDEARIRQILDTAKVLHLGLVDGDEPYVVPMNYGYTLENGVLTVYLHSAVAGRKLDVIQANPKIFFSLECDVVPFEGKVPCQYGTTYASVMGRGTAQILEDPQEKMRAMTILMKTQTGKDFTFNERLVSIVSVLELQISSFTARERPLPERLAMLEQSQQM